jgi:hypothetical protein
LAHGQPGEKRGNLTLLMLGAATMAVTSIIILAQVAQQQAPAPSRAGATPAENSSVTINVNTPIPPKGAELVGLLPVIVWPLVVIILAIVFRRQLRGAFTYVASNLKSFSVAGVSIELSERSAPPMVEAGSAGVDIRSAGTEHNVNDSTLRSFYEQIEVTSPLELAIVDLGRGHEWLTSRLYILSVILKRMRGLRAVVFVDDASDVHGHFVGICSSEVLRWRLARMFPIYEEALASGELRAANLPRIPPERPFFDNDEGRFGDRNAAAELLRGFLHHVQKPALNAGETAAWWQALENPAVFECAKWIDAPFIERLLVGALDMAGVPLSQFQFADSWTRSRIIFEQRSPWMPLVGFDGRFHAWIDRSAVVESLARRNLDAR